MAVVKMEKLALSFKAARLDEVLHLMQGFQGIHIETGFESSIPPAKKAEIDREIREAEKNLQDIHAASGILKGRESTNMLDFLKNAGEIRLSMAELTEHVEKSGWKQITDEVILTDRHLKDNRARRHEIAHLFEKLKIWERLGASPLDFAKLNRSAALFGSVHTKHVSEFSENLAKNEEDGISFELVAEDGDRAYFLLVFHVGETEKLNVLINEFSFSAENYPFELPQAEAKAQLEAEEAELVAREAELARLIEKQEKYDRALAIAEDYILNLLICKKKALEITYDEDNIEIDGWIVAERRGRFEKLLSERILAEDYDVKIGPAREKDIAEIPIKLKNNRLVTIYERLTELYSLPKYDELDPTPVMTAFYAIFFGLMVADAGYGLAVFLVGLFIKRFLKPKRSTRSFIDFLFYLSFPMMGWGLVFGSFCGMKLPFALLSVPGDIVPMIFMSIALGYLHIMVGLVMQMINKIKLKQYFEMATGGLAWFLSLLGGGMMILPAFAPFFAGDILFWAGAAILGAGAAMTIALPAVKYGRRWYAGIGKGLYSLYGATSYFGDFVSYTRLMALGVAGGSVALAFNTIIVFLPLPARFSVGIVLAVVLHGLNIVLSMLSAYVHGIRLQFIEFFNKFYTGGGKKFEPFKAAEKNVIISDADND